MAKANWSVASDLQEKIPRTYTAFEHLIMAMADAHNHKGKTSFFGHDKGLKSYMNFESRLKDALLALTLDGLVSRSDSAEKFRETLMIVFGAWFEIFPNWNDAQIFAYEKLVKSPAEACELISSLIGVQKSSDVVKVDKLEPSRVSQERKVIMPLPPPKKPVSGDARCPKCNHQDVLSKFELSDIGNLYRRCPSCGMNFQY